MFRKRFAAFCVALTIGASAVAGSFATHHPDQYFRALGEDAWHDGRHADARERFLSAARYADKSSQLALATMHWRGEGGPADRATAYAWADLAAERGYPDFVRVREAYWAKLSPDEQARAIDVGTALYARYGDDVARPRLDSLLRRGLAQKTGTRTGSAVPDVGVAVFDATARGSLAQRVTQAGGKLSLPVLVASTAQAAFVNAVPGAYYDPAQWSPRRYWPAQDAPWMPQGDVTVGPLRTRHGAPAPD